MMTSHLPSDLEEEILSRVPATSLMRWRCIRRRWNTLFEDTRFSEKHLLNAPKQSHVLMLKEYRLFFPSVDLSFVPPSIEFSDALSLKNYNILQYAYIVTVSHCDGLLLCTTLERELVVWNPCSGETRWIKRNDGSWWFHEGYSKFTLGYGNNQSGRRSYKVLSYCQRNQEYDQDEDFDFSFDIYYDLNFEIYDFKSSTWRVLNACKRISGESHGVTLKGNTYWISSGNKEGDLLSFDFTRERFRRLCLPLTSQEGTCSYMALSVVRSEELSVLCLIDSSKMEMWVTNKMDTNCEEADHHLSWSKYFTVEYGRLNIYSSVLIDQGKKVVLCDLPLREVVFTIGEEDEYYSETPFKGAAPLRHEHIFNYVPSLVQFRQQSIESDGYGKCRRRKWHDNRRRRGYLRWGYDGTSSSEESDDDMMSESDDERDWLEIECTDFSSHRSRSRRRLRRGWKTRCVTL